MCDFKCEVQCTVISTETQPNEEEYTSTITGTAGLIPEISLTSVVSTNMSEQLLEPADEDLRYVGQSNPVVLLNAVLCSHVGNNNNMINKPQ